tara:strand:- start:90 stop:278 length:189 start_codon:yes stop_codon:yes gene_type:complete
VPGLPVQLWGHVLWGAAQGVRFLTRQQSFSETEVRNLDVAFVVDEQILLYEKKHDVTTIAHT